MNVCRSQDPFSNYLRLAWCSPPPRLAPPSPQAWTSPLHLVCLPTCGCFAPHREERFLWPCAVSFPPLGSNNDPGTKRDSKECRHIGESDRSSAQSSRSGVVLCAWNWRRVWLDLTPKPHLAQSSVSRPRGPEQYGLPGLCWDTEAPDPWPSWGPPLPAHACP